MSCAMRRSPVGIARSTYYDAPSARLDNAELLSAITAICDAFEAYGCSSSCTAIFPSWK